MTKVTLSRRAIAELKEVLRRSNWRGTEGVDAIPCLYWTIETKIWSDPKHRGRANTIEDFKTLGPPTLVLGPAFYPAVMERSKCGPEDIVVAEVTSSQC